MTGYISATICFIIPTYFWRTVTSLYLQLSLFPQRFSPFVPLARTKRRGGRNVLWRRRVHLAIGYAWLHLKDTLILFAGSVIARLAWDLECTHAWVMASLDLYNIHSSSCFIYFFRCSTHATFIFRFLGWLQHTPRPAPCWETLC